MQQLETRKKEIVSNFLRRGILLSHELLKRLDDEAALSQINEVIKQHPKDILVLNEKIKELLDENPNTSLSPSVSMANTTQHPPISTSLDIQRANGHQDTNQLLPIKTLYTYDRPPKRREAQDFVDSLNHRFKMLSNILKQRQELQNTVSISRLLSRREKEQVALIGMVSKKQYTKNDNCMLTLEDQSGSINVLVSKNKPELFNLTKDIVMDEVIGITGTNGDKIIFANSMFFPEFPIPQEMKKCTDDVNVIFLSDLHVGSNNFLADDFEKFLRWINLEMGDEKQREIASKVKYIFVIGDLVDGCGVYPDQEKELTIKDIKEQYQECARLLSKIPQHIHLIVCPGNHDAMRVAEPQFAIYPDFAKTLYELPNITMLSNPSLVNIHASPTFPGFNVLLYHGYSFDYYVAEVDSIRNNGGYDRADLIMKFLLQKRHLAPAHTSTLYAPDNTHDALVIERVPDFFVSGHIHKSAASNYRNVTMICGSCWQSKTAFQEKVGHNPEPSRVPVVNLKTRNIRILRFGQ